MNGPATKIVQLIEHHGASPREEFLGLDSDGNLWWGEFGSDRLSRPMIEWRPYRQSFHDFEPPLKPTADPEVTPKAPRA